MVRLFHVYYPVRTVALLCCEALLVGASFVAATLLVLGPDSFLFFNYEGGALKISGIVALTLLCSYYLDLYAPQRLPSKSEIYFRLMTLVGVLALLFAVAFYALPALYLGPNVFSLGLLILAAVLTMWRNAYEWIIRQPMFRENVYILGSGEPAQRVIHEIRSRRDLGMQIVGGDDMTDRQTMTREDFATALSACHNPALHVDRIIVALSDRRGILPLQELLDLRLAGIKVEEATSLLEKVTCKIELEGFHPGSIVFGEGFKVNESSLLVRRSFSILFAASALLVILPLLPLIAIAVKLTSPGPVLFKQRRVGQRGQIFTLYKFRTMRQDAEVSTGAVWAQIDDPRITSIGGLLRKTRLDEIPQLWNVLRGDMGFVGPRPERPEFVRWLAEQIPYYNLRHIIRPGVTGWAQVRYQYGATLEETKRKLEYDLYYIKHISLSLDLLIVFETLKTILLRRGAQ